MKIFSLLLFLLFAISCSNVEIVTSKKLSYVTKNPGFDDICDFKTNKDRSLCSFCNEFNVGDTIRHRHFNMKLSLREGD